jgi:uncharacterized protein YcbX
MQVTQLFIYPIKSLGGIEIKQSLVTQRGLQYDRRFMLVDEHGVFLTQRTLHKMALFKLSLADNGFVVSFENKTIEIPFYLTGTTQQVTVWDDTFEAITADEKYNQWFSEQLNQPVKLVYMHQHSNRLVNPKYAQNNEQLSLADGYPVLVISESSLNLLNTKLAKPIGMDRFRPNVVINGAAPHQEDELGVFNMGSTQFKVAKPCGRCVVTTINQQTLQTSKEPLATLAKYRKVGDSVNFGANVICLKEGQIAVGDGIL